MKYLYRNVKTGDTVVTSTKVSGGNWVPVEKKPEKGAESLEQAPKNTKVQGKK